MLDGSLVWSIQKNLVAWQESDRMELVEEEDVLGLGYWAASAEAIYWMEHWTVEFPIPLKQTGWVEMCTFSTETEYTVYGRIFLLDWWRLVEISGYSTFAASTYLNMILLNTEVILWLLFPLENPQILDLIKHQKTKHYLVMLCLHCLCGMCFFVADLNFPIFRTPVGSDFLMKSIASFEAVPLW